MSLKYLGLAVAGLAAMPASAADKLAIAPPPAWVKPVAAPAAPDKPGEAPINLLLQDQQFDLQPQHQTRYFESVYRIQTSQGLPAGNVTLSWNPDTDVATVHKLEIHRGGTIIDVLKSGQTFTVMRRETNLENAMLDGVLTATIQPEGLQVGDIVDFSASISRSDPALKDHVEEIGGGWNGAPIARAHMRAQWPASIHMRLRSAAGLPELKPVREGNLASVELSLDDLQPLQAPRGAPLRYAISRIWEMSDFRSWADLAHLMAPLYVKASALPPQGALQAEIARIAQQSADPVVRAQAALALVQERVRYVFLGMNDGSLVPADAETTWSRRFGDCKAKTALLLALLHGLGIKAEPVIVNAVVGDGLDERLPAVGMFNHVLVRATINAKTYWLDGTRTGDARLDQIRTPYFRWGLPLIAAASLVPLVPTAPEQPASVTSVRIDASAGLSVPAPFHVESLWRDDAALELNLGLANLSPELRDTHLRQYWRKQYDFVDVKSVSATYDPGLREERLVMDGQAQMDWSSDWYETDGLGVGYKADFTRDPGQMQGAPFATGYPSYYRVDETILLPKGAAFSLSHPEDVDITVAGTTYHRHVAIAGDRFTGEMSARTIAPEFPAAEAAAAQKTLRALAEKTVYIGKPTNYRGTAREVDAAMLDKPADAEGFVRRGNLLLDNMNFDAAIADFTGALALDPKNLRALAGRGVAYAWKQESALAEADLAAAEKIDPKDSAIYDGRALLASNADHVQEAVDALTKAIALWPEDDFALYHRAYLYRALDRADLAIADAGEVLRLEPHEFQMHLLRANLYLQQGKRDLANTEASALAAAESDSDYAQVAAGMIYARAGNHAEAMKAFDRALAIAPSAYAYINRSRARPWRDFAGRAADIDAAAKVKPDAAAPDPAHPSTDTAMRGDPQSAMTLLARADLQLDQKDYSGAIGTLRALLANSPGNPDALLRRGLAFAKLGYSVAAEQDFAKARSIIASPVALAKSCRAKGEAGVMLDTALADCDAAIAKKPDDTDYLESRALVLLRLGRFGDAVKAYDTALARRPLWAPALHGRSLAEAGLGETAKSRADQAALVQVDADIADEFDRMGVAVPGTAKSASITTRSSH